MVRMSEHTGLISPNQPLIIAACTNTGSWMKGSHPRPADRCPFVLRHSISQVTSFMQLGMLCVLPPNLVKFRSHGSGYCNYRITLKFDRHFGSAAAEISVKCQCDWKSQNSNLSCHPCIYPMNIILQTPFYSVCPASYHLDLGNKEWKPYLRIYNHIWRVRQIQIKWYVNIPCTRTCLKFP